MHKTSDASQLILESLQWRYAVKTFDLSRKILDAEWDVLAESLRMAPSSYGVQPWKFIVVQNPALRETLRKVSWNQWQVTDCSHYVVIVAHEKVDEAHIDEYLDDMAVQKSISRESLAGFRAAMVGDLIKGPRSVEIKSWAQRQCYIAMGFLMKSAALLKIDSCPLEGFDPAAYNEILGLKGTHWGAVAAVALGHRSAEDATSKNKKVRFAKSRVVEFRE